MLRKEQQQWRDTFFATEDDDFKVMAGNEDGSLTLQGSEINLDGSVQIKVQDGSGGSTYRSLNTLPEAVGAVSGACILGGASDRIVIAIGLISIFTPHLVTHVFLRLRPHTEHGRRGRAAKDRGRAQGGPP